MLSRQCPVVGSNHTELFTCKQTVWQEIHPIRTALGARTHPALAHVACCVVGVSWSRTVSGVGLEAEQTCGRRWVGRLGWWRRKKTGRCRPQANMVHRAVW